MDGGARVPIDEMRDQMRNHTVFQFLESRFRNDIDLALFEVADREKLSEEWEDMESAINARRKMGVERDGLCLLLAFLLEGIQRRFLSMRDTNPEYAEVY
jgi:hypothetical protein